MTQNRLNVVFVAGEHLLSGTLDHGNNRILDVLNDHTVEMLTVYDVEILRQSANERVEHFEEMVIGKSFIDCVLLSGDKHETPLRRLNAAIVKEPRAVTVLLTHNSIRGTLMMKGNGNASMIVMRDASTFFPIVNPQLSGIGAMNGSLPYQVAFVNKTKVALISLEGRRPKPFSVDADASPTSGPYGQALPEYVVPRAIWDNC